MKHWKSKIILILGLLAMPLFVGAHGSGGYVEKIVDNYLVDIGYTNPILSLGDSNRFDFSVFGATDKKLIDFDVVWVKFEHDSEPVFIATLPRQGLNAAIMTYTFPRAGEYLLTVNYQKDQKTIVQTDLTLNVTAPVIGDNAPSGGSLPSVVYLVIGLITGLIVARLIRKKK